MPYRERGRQCVGLGAFAHGAGYGGGDCANREQPTLRRIRPAKTCRQPPSGPDKAIATSLAIALLTVSDTRTAADDRSGDLLAERLGMAGHRLAARSIVRDDIYAIRAIVSGWIADPTIDAVISTGGTGFTGRDSTPEALLPLFDKHIEGFGELFRQVSFEEIGSSTIQSRAVGGLANSTLVFALPGSTNACATGWDRILRNQLDDEFRPCNFAELIPRFREGASVRRSFQPS